MMMCATHGLSWLHIQEVKGLERAMGFEPTTTSLGSGFPLRRQHTVRHNMPDLQQFFKCVRHTEIQEEGAGYRGNLTRTGKISARPARRPPRPLSAGGCPH